MVLGGFCLRSATRVRQAAYWSSWADCFPKVHQRHPVAATLVAQLSRNPETRCLSAVREAKHELTLAGFESPSWQAIACGARPARREPEDHEPETVRRGWQHMAASVVEGRAREAMFTRASDQVKALIRSQGRSRGRSSLHSNTNFQETTILPTCFEFSCFADFVSSFPSRVVHADVALLWPPSCCVSLCWGAEPSGFLVGECSRPHLQRGWGVA